MRSFSLVIVSFLIAVVASASQTLKTSLNELKSLVKTTKRELSSAFTGDVASAQFAVLKGQWGAEAKTLPVDQHHGGVRLELVYIKSAVEDLANALTSVTRENLLDVKISLADISQKVKNVKAQLFPNETEEDDSEDDDSVLDHSVASPSEDRNSESGTADTKPDTAAGSSSVASLEAILIAARKAVNATKAKLESVTADNINTVDFSLTKKSVGAIKKQLDTVSVPFDLEIIVSGLANLLSQLDQRLTSVTVKSVVNTKTFADGVNNQIVGLLLLLSSPSVSGVDVAVPQDVEPELPTSAKDSNLEEHIVSPDETLRTLLTDAKTKVSATKAQLEAVTAENVSSVDFAVHKKSLADFNGELEMVPTTDDLMALKRLVSRLVTRLTSVTVEGVAALKGLADDINKKMDEILPHLSNSSVTSGSKGQFLKKLS